MKHRRPGNRGITFGRKQRRGPIRGWVGAIVVVVYWLLVPTVNSTFGWNLPELRQWANVTATQETNDDPSQGSSGVSTANHGGDQDLASSATKPDRAADSPGREEDPASSSRSAASSSASLPSDSPGSSGSDSLRYGVLRDLGGDRYLSPAGVIYGPGSAEGHRLAHLERHLSDQPSRPGSHGVFDGTMTEFLELIDEAYQRAQDADDQGGGGGVTRRDDEGRVVYTVNFNRSLGFVGGRDGNRRDRPSARRLRLVVDGNRMITAFPL